MILLKMQVIGQLNFLYQAGKFINFLLTKGGLIIIQQDQIAFGFTFFKIR